MVDNTRSYIVVAEDGGWTALTGSPEQSRGGAEQALQRQGRRGYLAMRQGDTLTLVEALNAPEVSFEEVQSRYLQRGHRTRRGSNTIFRNAP